MPEAGKMNEGKMQEWSQKQSSHGSLDQWRMMLFSWFTSWSGLGLNTKLVLLGMENGHKIWEH